MDQISQLFNTTFKKIINSLKEFLKLTIIEISIHRTNKSIGCTR